MPEEPPLLQDAPLREVRVSVEGLRGATREAALAAAESARGASSLAGLDDRLRAAAPGLGAAAVSAGESVAVEVSPGASHGCVCVAFRPQASWRLAARGGVGATMEALIGAEAEQCLTAAAVEGAEAFAPQLAQARLGLGGHVVLSRLAPLAVLRVTPLRTPWAGLFTTSAEISTGGLGMPRGFLGVVPGPREKAQRLALCAEDVTGRHALRLEAAERELLPDKEAAQEVLLGPLQSTKTSLSYHFVHDSRPAADAATGDLGRASVELAGLLGDVSLARAEGLWTRTRRYLGCIWSVNASAGVVVPLLEQGKTPWEDRFFLGGALCGPGERLPGFASRAVGPAAQRLVQPAETKPTKEFAFGPNWQTMRRIADRMTGASTEAAQELPRALDHLGGDARVSASAAVQVPLCPLPFTSGALQLHGLLHGSAAAVVGKVGPDIAQDLASEVRGSLGAGLGVPLPGGGFAGLTWSQPLLHRRDDQIQKLQFSVSFSGAF